MSELLAYGITFCVLGLLCFIIQYVSFRSRGHESIGNNPAFAEFRRKYFVAYFLALAGDWLQGPYLYKLYSNYGFQEDQIAVLYVCGFASTVLLGTWAPVVADSFGRKKLCIVCTVIYIIACFLKMSTDYGILLIGRVLGGVATSLLFTSYEAWYVHEHIDTHDFPKEWIAVTFKWAALWSGIISVAAGIIAEIFVYSTYTVWWPFMLAVPCFVGSALIVLTQWKENYGMQKIKFGKTCYQGLRDIAFNKQISLLGAVQSLFESVMYITVFLWTPLVNRGQLYDLNTPLGLIFSTFMISIMIGSGLFNLLSKRNVSVCFILAISMLMSMLSNSLCIIATHPTNIIPFLSYISLLLFEIAVGLYFPAMNYLRDRILPEMNKSAIINWFRVPLNIIACLVLMTLHNNESFHGNNIIFIICTCLSASALLSVVSLRTLLRRSGDLEELNRCDNGESQLLIV